MSSDSGHQISGRSGVFSERHLLIELHQFVGERWVETHRWNHGLAEELVEGKKYEHTHGTTKWTCVKDITNDNSLLATDPRSQ